MIHSLGGINFASANVFFFSTRNWNLISQTQISKKCKHFLSKYCCHIPKLDIKISNHCVLSHWFSFCVISPLNKKKASCIKTERLIHMRYKFRITWNKRWNFDERQNEGKKTTNSKPKWDWPMWRRLSKVKIFWFCVSTTKKTGAGKHLLRRVLSLSPPPLPSPWLSFYT